jgi:hypothetical protein
MALFGVITRLMMLLSRSEFKRLSYEGFYTMVLEKDAEIISVALLRFEQIKTSLSSEM